MTSIAPSWWARAALLCGLAALLVPSYVDVYQVFWQFERGAQAPIILLIVAALFWRERAVLRCWASSPPPISSASGRCSSRPGAACIATS